MKDAVQAAREQKQQSTTHVGPYEPWKKCCDADFTKFLDYIINIANEVGSHWESTVKGFKIDEEDKGPIWYFWKTVIKDGLWPGKSQELVQRTKVFIRSIDILSQV